MSARSGEERRLPGTRVRLFAQPPFLEGNWEPEVVELSAPAGSVGAGPSDERMFVIYPIGKPGHYGWQRDRRGFPHLFLPPWRGPILPPARPSFDGHLDHFEVGTPEFEMAHLYGTVRFALDIWEDYLGGPIPWFFEGALDRLELCILPEDDNARMGWGFLETGSSVSEGIVWPFSLNFDIVTHEVGHSLIYSIVGVPAPEVENGEYRGFHEAAADLVALITTTHLDSVVDGLLENSRGNLYTFNRLNRFGELSKNKQIRLAGNGRRLREFADGWSDEHALSEPLTGAIFDILVDVFHETLLDRRLISPEMEELADQVERVPEFAPLLQTLYDESYEADPAGFKDAFLEARDYLGTLLARAMWRLSPDALTFDAVGQVLLDVDAELTEGAYARLIRRNLDLRDIGRVRVGPKLFDSDAESHTASVRTATPQDALNIPKLSYRDRWILSKHMRTA